MAAGTKIIKSKIKSITSIRKITRTMEMISVSKMKKAVQQTLSVRPYAVHALELIESIAQETIESHALFTVPKNSTRELLVVIASNKGLCGSYNTNVARMLSAHIKAKDSSLIDVITVGKFSEKVARRLKLHVVASFLDLENYVGVDDTRVLAQHVLTSFESSTYICVNVLFTNYVKASLYKPLIRKVLPVSPKEIEAVLTEIDESKKSVTEELTQPKPLYTFEPNASQILDTVVPQLLHVIFHQILTESHASEHSARMFAMKQATDAANDMIKGLKLKFNRVRQDAVTQEIAEISSGAIALAE